MPEVQRAKLIHIEVDRRLGHEWDEWDGKPLPNQGNFDSPPWLFLAWSTVALAFDAEDLVAIGQAVEDLDPLARGQTDLHRPLFRLAPLTGR